VSPIQYKQAAPNGQVQSVQNAQQYDFGAKKAGI
jgi:hypothetical protein